MLPVHERLWKVQATVYFDQVIVTHALQVPEIARLLGKARKLVTLFHQSYSLNVLHGQKV